MRLVGLVGNMERENCVAAELDWSPLGTFYISLANPTKRDNGFL
jgi:hypothetical protein